MTIHVSLSGGLDSTTLLALAADRSSDIKAWTFNYGQRHSREVQAAIAVATHYHVDRRTLNLEGLLHGSALLYEAPLPEGHYTAETMEATVVNGRNLLFASAIVAQTQPGDEVWLGVHAGDHAIYPDCRPEFVNPLKETVATYGVNLQTPFLPITKAAIASLGHNLGAPLNLTWSCYAGGTLHCGRCGTCVERAEAFHLAGVPDPTDYADPDYWRTQCAVS